ncbi:hypothetical protein I204_05503 [Kwoniella mangroviensis CBS 8886]|nr:hypothetical protein I204_05503 [Kwoniella mangroviensis CBS 8886]
MATLVKEWEGAILQKNTRAEDVRRGTKEGERSKDPPEYHSDRGNQIGGPPTRGPPPRKSAPFEPEDSAIQVLHQLCVFEQVLQEVIAEKDGLKISPIRASLRIELYFEDIIKPFLVKLEIEGQIGLYQQNALATKALHPKDLQFVVFSFPEEIDDISEAGFEEGLTFEHEVDGREITLIGLGPARTIIVTTLY